jgi:hypothetical protein
MNEFIHLDFLKYKDGMRMQLRVVIWICIIGSLVMGRNLSAGISPLIHAVQWNVPGRVNKVLPWDMNLDGKCDLLVFSVSVPDDSNGFRRHLSLFLSDSGSTTPDQTLALRDAIAFDVADLNGDNFTDLIFLCKEEIYSLQSESGRIVPEWQSLIQTASVFPGADINSMIRYSLTADLDGDLTPEIIIPAQEGVRIYQKSDSLYQPIRNCMIRPQYRFVENDGMDLIIHSPRLLFTDFDGDSRSDLIHLIHDRVRVFLNPSILSHQDTALSPDLEYDLGSRRLTHSSVDQVAPVSHRIQMIDLNRDGYSDLLLSQAARSSYINTISQLYIYLNDRGALASFPDQILTAENFAGEYRVRDLNGDGLQDIILFNLDIGYTAAVRFVLTRKVIHHYEIYLMRNDHTYPSKPDSKLTVKMDPRERPLVSILYALSRMDDFTGDGCGDLLIATARDTWILCPGRPDGAFLQKDRIRIQARTAVESVSTDLNGDGAADLVFWDEDDPEGALKILLSGQESAP